MDRHEALDRFKSSDHMRSDATPYVAREDTDDFLIGLEFDGPVPCTGSSFFVSKHDGSVRSEYMMTVYDKIEAMAEVSD